MRTFDYQIVVDNVNIKSITQTYPEDMDIRDICYMIIAQVEKATDILRKRHGKTLEEIWAEGKTVKDYD